MAGLDIRVDARLELLQIVMYLTHCRDMAHQTTLRTSYTDALEQHFGSFREHKAVRMAADLLERSFTYGKPVRLAFYLGYPPELNEAEPVERYLAESESRLSQTAETIREYLSALREFAQQSCFDAFWSRQKDYLELIKRALTDAIKATVTDELEAYFGQQLGGYHLVASPLAGNYGVSTPIPRPESAYCVVMTPYQSKDGSLQWPSHEVVTNTCKHEFGHCYVNPVTSNYLPQIEELQALRQQHKDVPQFYNWWPTIINESIIRACQARFFSLYPEDGLRNLGNEWVLDPHEAWLSFCEKQMGLPLIRGLEQLLVEYEANRKCYRSFQEFYPVIVDWLQQEEKAACGA